MKLSYGVMKSLRFFWTLTFLLLARVTVILYIPKSTGFPVIVQLINFLFKLDNELQTFLVNLAGRLLMVIIRLSLGF